MSILCVSIRILGSLFCKSSSIWKRGAIRMNLISGFTLLQDFRVSLVSVYLTFALRYSDYDLYKFLVLSTGNLKLPLSWVLVLYCNDKWVLLYCLCCELDLSVLNSYLNALWSVSESLFLRTTLLLFSFFPSILYTTILILYTWFQVGKNSLFSNQVR